MRGLAWLTVALTGIFAVAAAHAYERPDRERPYMDNRDTLETTGYGKLTYGTPASGWLVCEYGKALVGVTVRRGRVLDNVQIHCATIVQSGGADALGFPGFTWSYMDNNPQASAGGGGGETTKRFACTPGFVISGMSANVNSSNEIVDLTFECAKALGSVDMLPTTGRVTRFEAHCQPTTMFTIFPLDGCLTDQTRTLLNQMRFRDRGTGQLQYRYWLPGFGNVRASGDDQKCERYGAVGLTFLEELFRTYIGAFTVVVPSLRLVCIAPYSVLRRLRPRPRR